MLVKGLRCFFAEMTRNGNHDEVWFHSTHGFRGGFEFSERFTRRGPGLHGDLRVGMQLLQGGLDLLIVRWHGENGDRFALAEEFEGVRERIRRWHLIAQRNFLPGDGLRDGFCEQLVAVHVRMNGVAEEEVPVKFVSGPHGFKGRVAVRQPRSAGPSQITNGLAELRQSLPRPLRGIYDGVLRAQHHLRTRVTAVLGDCLQIAYELRQRHSDQIIHPKHDRD